MNNPAPAPLTPEELMGIALLPGTRVFDTITGLEGVVLHGTIEHTTVPAPAASKKTGDHGEAQQRPGGETVAG